MAQAGKPLVLGLRADGLFVESEVWRHAYAKKKHG